MKYLILVVAVFSSSVMAGSFNPSARANSDQSQGQGQIQGQLQGQSQSQRSSARSSSYSSSTGVGVGVGVGISGGNSMSVGGDTFEAADVAHIAPTVFAPSLTTGVCMGSASGGASGQGFGFSFGSTTVDEECQIRRNAILLNQLGMVSAAHKIMCQIESVKAALVSSGSLVCGAPESENSAKSEPGTNVLGFQGFGAGNAYE